MLFLKHLSAAYKKIKCISFIWPQVGNKIMNCLNKICTIRPVIVGGVYQFIIFQSTTSGQEIFEAHNFVPNCLIFHRPDYYDPPIYDFDFFFRPLPSRAYTDPPIFTGRTVATIVILILSIVLHNRYVVLRLNYKSNF